MYPRSWLALVHVYRGRWDEGARLAQDVLRGVDDPISRVSALIALGRVRARRGDPGASMCSTRRSSWPARRPPPALGHVHSARAEAAWLAGDPDRTIEEARPPTSSRSRNDTSGSPVSLRTGSGGQGLSTMRPSGSREPYRLQLRGDARGAAGLAYAPLPLRGRAHPGRRGRRVCGSHELEGLGARPSSRRLRRRLGLRGPREATREQPGRPDHRELEVLQLVAAGLQNREIAERLVALHAHGGSPRFLSSSQAQRQDARGGRSPLSRNMVADDANMGDSADVASPVRP